MHWPAIRGTGAKNIVIAGGLDRGYDLSGVLKGFALKNQTGNGIMYSSHFYPWKDDWQGIFAKAGAGCECDRTFAARQPALDW